VTDPILRLKRPEEYFPSPEDCRAMEEVQKEIRESDLGEEGRLRELNDWSSLANLAVGAEGI
jgi:hypothetical protein